MSENYVTYLEDMVELITNKFPITASINSLSGGGITVNTYSKFTPITNKIFENLPVNDTEDMSVMSSKILEILGEHWEKFESYKSNIPYLHFRCKDIKNANRNYFLNKLLNEKSN